MKEEDYADFSRKLDSAKERRPVYGQIELTYRCGYRCVHCYCKNGPKTELGFDFWKGVFNQLQEEGCLELTLTGGDPVLHKDFARIYGYAWKKGFLISLFTNAHNLTDEVISLLEERRPLNIEITLNSLDSKNYERITGVRDSFDKTIANIQKLKKRSLPLVLKCNGLKENRREILKIKRFTEELLGKGKFKYDGLIFPGLNGEKEPALHRLEPEDVKDIEKEDKDMLEQRMKEAGHQSRWFNPDGLYHCNSWWTHFYINPEGLLQFCHLSKQFSTDLTKESFRKGFDRFPRLLEEKPKTSSRCHSCELKEHCFHCPARAYLETGDMEAPVSYYCRLAKIEAADKKEGDA
ncbi:MAG: radical SAM protein [Candidatus Omnitrophota bacterium]